MQDPLKNLKTALDDSIYQGKSFDHNLEKKTLNRLRTKRSSHLLRIRRLLPMLAVPVLLFITYILVNHNIVNERMIEETSQVSTSHELVKGIENILLVIHVENDFPSVMLLNANEKENEIKYLHLPHRISFQEHLVEFSGRDMMKNELENLLGIEISRRIEMNASQLGESVEEVGGIVVTNPLAFGGFAEGRISLKNRDDVINFISMRKEVPYGSNGRNNRMISVLKEITRKNEEGLIKGLPKMSNYIEQEDYFQVTFVDSKWIGVIDTEQLSHLRETLQLK
ncbi:hypothetical protein FZW96_01350 [Bacillus sp. BGMRC 2118]|nr:hypothetical protein FZW96_01350 [Bacillus sp. BGMRC 2118]